ncbi:MAG: protein kinase [Burkholderiales bacterium]|nr:protein kinase [Burkholderiales bacterium]
MSTPDPSTQLGNPLPIGHRLHEFVIEGLVGEGGFGIVYLARDTQLERTVAIKEYMPASLASRGADFHVQVRSERYRDTFALGLRSFVNEAKLLALFDHPALIKVYRFWEDNGTAYMVMPYYQGPTLKTWLKEHGTPPDEAWLKGMLSPLLEALEVIHADSCYHRDIAPDNILLLGPNKPLLLDFGAARRVIGDATQALTVILKPGYAPIEQYAEVASMKQGPWTDVYALCAVLYAAITGKAPVPSVGRMMKDELVPISELAAGQYSPAFLAAIDAGLAVQPDQRIHDVAALRARLFDEEPASAPDAFPPATDDDERTQVFASPPPGLQAHLTHVGHATTAPQPAPTATPSASHSELHTVQTTPAVMPLNERPTLVPPPAASTATVIPTSPAPANKAGLWAGVAAALALAGGGAWWWGHSTAHVPASVSPSGTAVSSAPLTTPAASTVGTASTSASGLTTSAPPARPPFTPVAALEDIVRHADPLMSVNILPNKSQVVIGQDKLLFRVKSSEPGYVYVYLAGTDDAHFYLLFPNAIDRNNHIDADRQIELPRKGWHITAGGPPGVDHIVTIVSPTPRDLTAIGLKASDTIPEFDLDLAKDLWAKHPGTDSPFVGPALCEAGQTCEQRYGASLVRIEEVVR